MRPNQKARFQLPYAGRGTRCLAYATACFLSGCTSNPCGLFSAGVYQQPFAEVQLDSLDLDRVTEKSIEAAGTTSDPRLGAGACSSLQGFRVFTLPTSFDWNGELARGASNCTARFMVVAEPTDGHWEHTSLTHEMFHVMQNCAADPANPEVFHANWVVDGLFKAASLVFCSVGSEPYSWCKNGK